MAGMILAAPFINLIVYVLLAFTVGIEYAGITFGIWLVLLFFQHLASKSTKTLKSRESAYNDVRQKLIADMVMGARTIKAYGWEKHYMDKVISARRSQVHYVFRNGGLFVIVAVLSTQFSRGIELKEGETMSLMAMIFYLFIAVNSMTYHGMTTVQTFLSVVERAAAIFEMDEYHSTRKENVKPEDVELVYEDVDISWGFKVK